MSSRTTPAFALSCQTGASRTPVRRSDARSAQVLNHRRRQLIAQKTRNRWVPPAGGRAGPSSIRGAMLRDGGVVPSNGLYAKHLARCRRKGHDGRNGPLHSFASVPLTPAVPSQSWSPCLEKVTSRGCPSFIDGVTLTRVTLVGLDASSTAASSDAFADAIALACAWPRSDRSPPVIAFDSLTCRSWIDDHFRVVRALGGVTGGCSFPPPL